MDTRPPHKIVSRVPHGDHEKHWLPITEAERQELEQMTEAARAAWLAAIPTKERLARTLEREGLTDLAAQARLGRFDDYDEGGLELPCVELHRALLAAGRKDLAQRAVEGEWDATHAESDAWAARQTGETKDILQRMNLNKGSRGPWPGTQPLPQRSPGRRGRI